MRTALCVYAVKRMMMCVLISSDTASPPLSVDISSGDIRPPVDKIVIKGNKKHRMHLRCSDHMQAPSILRHGVTTALCRHLIRGHQTARRQNCHHGKPRNAFKMLSSHACHLYPQTRRHRRSLSTSHQGTSDRPSTKLSSWGIRCNARCCGSVNMLILPAHSRCHAFPSLMRTLSSATTDLATRAVSSMTLRAVHSTAWPHSFRAMF